MFDIYYLRGMGTLSKKTTLLFSFLPLFSLGVQLLNKEFSLQGEQILIFKSSPLFWKGSVFWEANRKSQRLFLFDDLGIQHGDVLILLKGTAHWDIRANRADKDQTIYRGAVWSVYALFLPQLMLQSLFSWLCTKTWPKPAPKEKLSALPHAELLIGAWNKDMDQQVIFLLNAL